MNAFEKIAEALNRAAQVHLPPPSNGLRTYDYNETLVMFRNRDRYMSTPPSPSLPPLGGAGGGNFSGDLK